ncbi:MAG: hypothetical protein IPH22_08750 [Nitrosomonas sp.]|nr:hypothetical protein [Nitrosomonas sp.]
MQEELLDDTMRVSLTNLAEGVETLTRKMKILADLLDLKMIKNPPPSGIVVKAHQLIEDATY